MPFECGFSMLVVFGVGIVFVRHERGFGVNDEVPVFREVQHDIRL